MDSRQLAYFAAIYEQGSLSRAAGQTSVAASALSHHLANLEAELGTALFARKPRGVEPTAAGVRLYEHARGILRAMETARRDIIASGGEVAGEVAIGMAHSAVRAIGVALMRRVLADHPKLRLSIAESLSGTTFMSLLAGEVDLALVYNPPPEPRLAARPVLEERMICVGRPDIIGAGGAPIAFAELLDLPVILLRQGISARALMDDGSLLRKLEARAVLRLNSVQAIEAALEAGLGCAIGTTLFMKAGLESGRLAMRPIVEPVLMRSLHLCELADRPPSFAQEHLRAMLLELIGAAIADGTWAARSLIAASGDG